LWRFKALQHIVSLSFRLKLFDDMLSRYKLMLADMPSVTRNECTEAINMVLETVSNSNDDGMLTNMFEITLDALKTANNERLWFNTTLKLTKLYMQDVANLPNRQAEVEHLMTTLKQTCQLPDGTDNPDKASNLLEIYCLEIQYCRLTRNGARMRTIYPKTLNLNAAVADPRIMGVIREEGGKMHMSENHWDEAFDELNEAFRNFQSAGNNARAKTCLKYVALASMLSKNAVNPFDGREAKVFERDAEIVAMKELRLHLTNNDLVRFEQVLNDRRNGISTEEVLMPYIDLLRKRMREHVLLNMVRPYKKVTLAFLAKQLRLDVLAVEEMLVSMIQHGEICAVIDQIEGYVLLGDGEGNGSASSSAGSSRSSSGSGKQSIQEKKATAMGVWADALVHINQNLSIQLS
jgi:COP9 signalosome complex subunit 2